MPQLIAPELVERMPLDQLRYLDGNPNIGDHDRIREILLTLGQVENIVVNRGTHTGVPNEIAGGNNRVMVMHELGWIECAVSWIDVDRITLDKIALALNNADEHARMDQRLLAEMTARIVAASSIDNLVGTGISTAAYDELVRSTDLYGVAAGDFLADLITPAEQLLPAAPEPSPAGSAPAAPAEAPAAPAAPTSAAPAAPHSPTPAAADPAGDTPPAAARQVSQGYVAMSWTVLPDERDLVVSALRTAQRRWRTETQANALVLLCEQFLRETT